MKKSLLAVCLSLCMLLSQPAFAQANVTPAEPLQGTTNRAEGALSYQLPQLEEKTGADESINRFYQEKALFLDSETDALTDINTISFRYELASDRFLSIVFSVLTLGGNGETETLYADTFARDGVYEGEKLTLSVVLGMEDEEGQSAAASEMAYQLVWEMARREAEKADGDYPEGMTEEDVRRSFDPETDFYLDADGNIVFFIQAGELAGEIAGILFFPFSLAELLSAAVL